MGATWSAIGTRLEYMFYDPKAEEYAQKKAEREAQKAADDRRRAEIAQSQLTEQQKKEANDEITAKEKADREALATRSQFNISQLIGQSSDGIYFHVKALLLTCFMIYGGHIAVNQAIGYNIPFRILTFVYGMLCSIYIVPKALYDIYWKHIDLPYYAFFPLSTYQPKGNLEKYIIGPFCYIETPEAVAAREAVVKLYESGFVKTVQAIAGATATVGAIAGSKGNKPRPSAPAAPGAAEGAAPPGAAPPGAAPPGAAAGAAPPGAAPPGATPGAAPPGAAAGAAAGDAAGAAAGAPPAANAAAATPAANATAPAPAANATKAAAANAASVNATKAPAANAAAPAPAANAPAPAAKTPALAPSVNTAPSPAANTPAPAVNAAKTPAPAPSPAANAPAPSNP